MAILVLNVNLVYLKYLNANKYVGLKKNDIWKNTIKNETKSSISVWVHFF